MPSRVRTRPAPSPRRRRPRSDPIRERRRVSGLAAADFDGLAGIRLQVRTPGLKAGSFLHPAITAIRSARPAANPPLMPPGSPPPPGRSATSQVRKVRILSTNRLTAASVGKSRLAPGLSSEEWKYMVSTRPPRRRWR